MGITEFTLNFNGSEGSFDYKNAQGEKSLPFGMTKNIFGLFPEEATRARSRGRLPGA